MIGTTDIGNILYRDCKAFGIDEDKIYVVFEKDDGVSREIPLVDPKKGLREERIVIYVKRQQPDTYWIKSFNEVNIQIPRLQNRANRIRLQEIEHKAVELLDSVAGEWDGSGYLYQIESIGTEADTALKCHYVNVRIMFQVLNVK